MSINLNLKIQKKDLWLLAAIVIFLVGVGYVIAYNSNWQTSPGNPAVMGHTPDEIMVKNSSGSLISLQTLIDQGGVGGSCSFGSRVLLSNNSVQTFIRQASTDGFVNTYAYDSNMWIYSDSNNPPTTLIAYDDLYHSGSSSNMMVPIKQGDYFKVYVTGGDSKIDKVYWLPLNC